MADNKLRVQLIGDASKLNSSLNTASARLKKFGKSAKNIGASMQRFALPLAIAGGAAIKMGVDFDKSMTKIKSLVGLAGDQVDKMGKQARQMAIETGQSSTAAADALFFITSAGLSGSDAMDVLNASLKASAVGLGDVTQVADAATSAMNAYGSDALSASDATDVLVAAVREGKLSSEELAGAIGQVIPIASNMGVTFNEVGATMAAMSRTGTNAATASMQLKNILMSINKPSKEAADTLAAMGLSAGALKSKIQDDGLLATLELLKAEFGQNADAQAKVFGNSRALMGVMDLLGKGIDSTREIFGKMNNVQGDTQKAFDKTAESASFKLTKSLNTAKESFSQMGAVLLQSLLPLIQDLAGVITRIFGAFNSLDVNMQRFISAVGVLAIALPTLISLFGTVMTVVGALLSPVGLVAAALAGVAIVIYKNWNEVAPVLVNFYNMFVDLYNQSALLRGIIGTLKATFKSVFISAKMQIDLLSNSFKTMWKLIKEFSEKGFKGDFKQILAEGFLQSTDIAKQGGEDIAETFTTEMSKALSNQLEHKTVNQLNAGIANIVSKAKGKITSLLSGNSFGGPAGGGGGDNKPKGLQTQGVQSVGLDPISQMAISSKEGKAELQKQLTESNTILQNDLYAKQQKIAQFQEIAGQVGGFMSSTFAEMGNQITQSLGMGESALGTFVGTLIQSAMAALSATLATTMGLGAVAAGETAAASGPFAAFVLPALLAGAAVAVKGAFGKVDQPKKFAKGGIVSTPTMGLMGEYPGARSNPEVIAPLDKLKDMIGDRGGSSVQVGGEFVLKGQDLIVALQRANNQRDRII